MLLGKLDNTCKRIKLDPYLIPLTEINLKWTARLSVRPETVKLLQGTQGVSHSTLVLAMKFLVTTLKD